jgi:hypothetical protein
MEALLIRTAAGSTCRAVVNPNTMDGLAWLRKQSDAPDKRGPSSRGGESVAGEPAGKLI